MSEEDKKPLPSTTSSSTASSWTSVQAYLLASFCLVLGVALGYLFRGSASSVPQTAAATQSTGVLAENAPVQAALQQSIAPLLDAVNRNPADYDALVKLGDLHYDGHSFRMPSNTTSEHWRFIRRIPTCAPTWAPRTGTPDTPTKRWQRWRHL